MLTSFGSVGHNQLVSKVGLQLTDQLTDQPRHHVLTITDRLLPHHVLTITDRLLPHHVIDRNPDRQVYQHIVLQVAHDIDNHVTGADRSAQVTGPHQEHQQGQCLDHDHLQELKDAANEIKRNNGIIAEIDEDEVIGEITINGKYFALLNTTYKSFKEHAKPNI